MYPIEYMSLLDWHQPHVHELIPNYDSNQIPYKIILKLIFSYTSRDFNWGITASWTNLRTLASPMNLQDAWCMIIYYKIVPNSRTKIARIMFVIYIEWNQINWVLRIFIYLSINYASSCISKHLIREDQYKK